MLDPGTRVPTELVHARFVATPLTGSLAALDHAAYMASPDVVRTHSAGRWPVDEFTFAEDLELVAKHQTDHESRRAFTFALLAPGRDESLGCLYLNPLQAYLRRVCAGPQLVDSVPEASAMVTFWLRQDEQETGLAEAVVAAVNTWLVDDWTLSMHAFRILPTERSSRRALEALGLRAGRPVLPDESRPYLWYRRTT